MAASAALVCWFVYSSAIDDPATAAAAGAPDQAVATAAEIAEPGGFLTALGTVSTLAGVVLLSLWAIATARDYSTGMIRILVQAQPDQVKLLGGKIVGALFTLLATLTTILALMLAARPLARLEGIDTEAWSTDFAPHFLNGLFNFSIAGLVWGFIGLALAVLTRSSELAIGIGIGYLLVVENLIGLIAPDATVYLPGGTLNALVSGGTSELAWGLALGLVVIYGIVGITVSLLVFRARDISS
jgi:ABC-2 type transport system permease protein